MSNDTKTTEPTRDACVTYLQTHGIYSGHSRDSIDQLRQLVTDHKATARRDSIGDALDGNVLFPEGPDRVAAAKTEHKLLQVWIKSGENPPRPATPNLDALNEAYAAGETAAQRHRRTKGKTVKAEEAPAPKATAGTTVLTLRNPAHGVVVADALADVNGAEVQGRYLVLANSAAQEAFETLVVGAEDATQFTTRLLVLAQLLVRQAFPKVVDSRNGLVPRLVNHLCGSGASWSVTWASDATPVFTIDGTEFTTTRAAAEAVGVPTKVVAAAA